MAKVAFLETPKFANEINSELFETVQLTVLFESENFYGGKFNMLSIVRTIEWEWFCRRTYPIMHYRAT